MEPDAFLDLLLDLEHDLGKYLLLPIAWLPKSASEAELREALRRALTETRSQGGQTRSARSLWGAFEAEVATHPELEQHPGFARLRAAVERALGWERELSQLGGLEREAIERDFRDVRRAITDLAREVQRG